MEKFRKGLPDPNFVSALPIGQALDLQFTDRLPGRRGGAFQYTGKDGYYIVKAVDELAPSDFLPHLEPRAVTIPHEALILKELGNIVGDVYISDGKHESIVWLLMRAIDAPTAIQVCDRIRLGGSSEKNLAELVSVFASIANKIAEINEAGFLHGDLQPSHLLIHPTKGVYVLDFEFARQISDKETRYTGGLIHYNSPEVAVEMLARADNIPYDSLSEVYSLGATIFTLYTRQPLPNYGAKNHKELPLDHKLQSIVRSDRNTFANTNSYPFQELESVIQWATAPNREGRCSSTRELADRLLRIGK